MLLRWVALLVLSASAMVAHGQGARTTCTVKVQEAQAPAAYAWEGGVCSNGLLDGLVKLSARRADNPDRLVLLKIEKGRAVGHGLRVFSAAGVTMFVAFAVDGEGRFLGEVSCAGDSAKARAGHDDACRSAARLFGVAAFEDNSVAAYRLPASSDAADSQDDPKVLGGSYRR